MNLSQLAFQGYLEKTGINIKEAEQLAQITRTPMQDSSSIPSSHQECPIPKKTYTLAS